MKHQLFFIQIRLYKSTLSLHLLLHQLQNCFLRFIELFRDTPIAIFIPVILFWNSQNWSNFQKGVWHIFHCVVIFWILSRIVCWEMCFSLALDVTFYQFILSFIWIFYKLFCNINTNKFKLKVRYLHWLVVTFKGR